MGQNPKSNDEIAELMKVDLNNNIFIYINMINILINDVKNKLYINNAWKNKILIAQQKYTNLNERLKHFEILGKLLIRDKIEMEEKFEFFKSNFDIIIKYDVTLNKNEEEGKYWCKNDWKYPHYEQSKKYWCNLWT